MDFDSFALESIRGVVVGAVEAELLSLLLVALPPPLLVELERLLDPSVEPLAAAAAAAVVVVAVLASAAAALANAALYDADITLTPPVPTADATFWDPRGDGDGREEEDDEDDALEVDEEPLFGAVADDAAAAAAFDDTLEADVVAFAADAVVVDPDDFETLRLPPPPR